MELSVDLLSQFAKITKDNGKSKKETTVYGITVEYNNAIYVKLDGSDLLTPVYTTADTKAGERVTVMIKNHTATITGNMSSPAARTGDVQEATKEITNLQADNISIRQSLSTTNAVIGELQVDNANIKSSLSATNANIETLKTANATITQTLSANTANIGTLQTENATIKQTLTANNASIETLQTDNATIKQTLTANNASIEKLNTEKLSAEDIKGKYANIDFSNIGKAAFEYLFSKSGLIENVVIGEGTITGNLVGVTIKGDLIEGNTIKADKLVIKGIDGLYYKLNTDGVKTEAEQTDQNSLNGSVITAKSITATKINVDDLVAFDATIGGFNITDSAIYSGVKESVDNTTQGIYLDKDGQIVIGDASNYLRYYKDDEGNYKLEISAETLSQQLSDFVMMLVTDSNGESLMVQTENGWTFSTGQIQSIVDDTSEKLNDLTNTVGDVNSAVDILKQAVDDLGVLSEYVNITTYEGEPCIELGEADSDFKLIITNTRIMFMEGTGVPAYINNQSLHIKKAVVEEELQQGEFIWKARSNGNLGLIWKGVSS